MSIPDIIWGIAFVCSIIIGILGLVFYKSFKYYFLKISFSFNPLNLPQQSNSQINFVLIGILIFLIFWGSAGIFGIINDYILKL